MSAAGPGVRLLAITPPHGAVDPEIVDAWEAARAVGLAVLLREPGTRPRALVDDAHRLAPLRRACAAAGVPCLLSADPSALPEVEDALRTPGLVGVQLRGDPDRAQLQAARRRLGPGVVLGRSCHGEPLALGPNVDYSVFAPVFPPRTASPTPGPGKVAVGLAALAAFTARERHVLALGGVTPATAGRCLAAGAHGLASIRTFFGPKDEVRDDVARLVALLTEPVDDAAPPPRSR